MRLKVVLTSVLLGLLPVVGCGEAPTPGTSVPGAEGDPSSDADGGTVDSDAGTDGGTVDSDAGTDGGTVDPDAGTDGGTVDPDAGTDGGTVDPDAGTDGGTVDPDAGTDGGTVDPDGGTDGGTVDPDGGTDGGTAALPDLVVSAARLEDTWFLSQEFFGENSCAWEERCLTGFGDRLLLRFATEIQNVGTADLVLGSPVGDPDFEFATCHGHYHLRSSTDQALVDASGAVVAEGLKQGFCWTDNERVPEVPYHDPKYFFAGEDFCNVDQGLTIGWADVYTSDLDCQWIDVTDVPDGTYTLRVTANPIGYLEELDYDNNTAEVQVTISRGALQSLPQE